jgi:hypothetical protein
VPRRRLSTTEFLTWTTLGATAGLAAGLILAEWLGDVDRHRVKRALKRVTAPPQAKPMGAEAAERAAERVLRAAPAFGILPLTVQGVRRGVVGLTGWVNSRVERIQAVAAVREIPGIIHVLDRILVRGEDDGELLAAEAS